MESRVSSADLVVTGDVDVRDLVKRWGFRVVGSSTEPFFFSFHDQKLELCHQDGQRLQIDFAKNKTDYRRPLRGKNEILAKVFGLSAKTPKTIFDFTGGLLVDALCFVRLGASVVHVWERSRWLIPLIDEALSQQQDPQMQSWLERLKFHPGNAELAKDLGLRPEGIFLDPMFEEYNEKALPKGKFQFLRKLISEPTNNEELLTLSLELATERVVVKRPIWASPLVKKPSYQVEGRKIRYDIYRM